MKNLTPEKVLIYLVELVGENPFLKIKSIKNYDTSEDITERFTDKDVDDVNFFWVLTNRLEWVVIM